VHIYYGIAVYTDKLNISEVRDVWGR